MDSVIEDSVDRQALRESILADGIRILRDLDELDSRLEQEEALTALRRAALQLVQFSGLLLQPPAGLDQLTAFPEPRIKAFLEATDDLQNQLRTLDSQFHAVESKAPGAEVRAMVELLRRHLRGIFDALERNRSAALEAQADADIVAGRVKKFGSGKAAVTYLRNRVGRQQR